MGAWRAIMTEKAAAQRREEVVLVDSHDRELGTEEKLAAHQSGKLHRAFSVFLFDRRGRLLLQQRARAKYHSGGLWSNTCCSHPRPGEDALAAAGRRLVEEMGIAVPLIHVFDYSYRCDFDNGLTEHEYVYVFFGDFDGEPLPNPQEVDAWKWVELDWLAADVRRHPGSYSYWLGTCLPEVLRHRAATDAPGPRA